VGEERLTSSRLARRRFLEKAGKVGIYAPPAMYLLMHPGAEAIASANTAPTRDRKWRKKRRRRWWG